MAGEKPVEVFSISPTLWEGKKRTGGGWKTKTNQNQNRTEQNWAWSSPIPSLPLTQRLCHTKNESNRKMQNSHDLVHMTLNSCHQSCPWRSLWAVGSYMATTWDGGAGGKYVLSPPPRSCPGLSVVRDGTGYVPCVTRYTIMTRIYITWTIPVFSCRSLRVPPPGFQSRTTDALQLNRWGGWQTPVQQERVRTWRLVPAMPGPPPGPRHLGPSLTLSSKVPDTEPSSLPKGEQPS